MEMYNYPLPNRLYKLIYEETRLFFASKKYKFMTLRNKNLNDDWLWNLYENEIQQYKTMELQKL
jgi:hypothetical protein